MRRGAPNDSRQESSLSAADRRAAKREPTLIERVVEFAVVATFVVWCFRIAQPLIVPVLWGMIIAVALHAPFARLRSADGGKRTEVAYAEADTTVVAAEEP